MLAHDFVNWYFQNSTMTKVLVVILLLSVGHAGQMKGAAAEIDTGTDDPNQLQRSVRDLVAKYLVDMTMVDDETESRHDADSDQGPIPYGKHHSHRQRDRYEQLLQRLQEQEKRMEQLKQSGSAGPPAPAPAVVNPPQAKQEPVAATPPSTVALPYVTAQPTLSPVSKEEAPTPIPIVLATQPSAVEASPASGVMASPVTTYPPVTPRPTVDPVHHINQVNKILGNVANGNIVGIVDESLAIRAPPPVRNLVTNIMKVIFCNPIDRLFGRCAPNQIDAANNSVKG